MTTLLDRLKSFYINNPWKGRIILSFMTLLLIFAVIRISLPQTIIYSATSLLKKQGVESSIENIKISLIDGTISLINAKGSKDNKPLFNVGLIDIQWEWAPLSEKTFEVTKIALDKLTVNLEQYTDQIIIGGVRLPLNTTESSKDTTAEVTAEEVTPWAAALGEVAFSNLNICYLQHTAPFAEKNDQSRRLDYCVALAEMKWNGSLSYATDKSLLNTDNVPLTSSGNFLLNGLNVIDNKLNRNLLTSASNNLNNVVIKGLNDIHIDRLEMNDLSIMQRDDTKHIDAVRFQQLAVDNIKISNLNALSIVSVALSDPGLYMVRNTSSEWEYMQWLPPSSNEDSPAVSSDENVQAKSAPFTFDISRINITNSDFCYLDKTDALYYCFTLEDFDWDGSLSYNAETPEGMTLNLAASGDLSLMHPNVYNHNLQRNLLDFKSLAISNITVNGGDNLTIKGLILKELKALQRSDKVEDNTLSFDDLTIKDVKYSPDNIAINTISINGLADYVSKNKDGHWEHDKWLPKSQNSKTSAPDSDSDSSPANNKPLRLSLNEFSIISDKNITFTDNSTEPALEAGLDKLVFELSAINTAKPDTDSPFKLQAKSSRHATIDVEGTARPFAEKISFNAKGILKGFDLRAASPATKKAIGHMIKSGQLDADLKLRATEGVLDSNVALSLYQFHIKPMSKKDSEALDKKFGMPLNQTLVLLRDKDDSIHLDIPITGDINNPDFNPTDAIIKATSKAASVTLITFFTPYGLIYAGGNAVFDLATALNFDPVIFKPGSSELIDTNKEQLNKLAELMTSKPQIHLTLCGVTNQNDLFALYPDTKKLVAEKNANEMPLTAEQSAALKKLAMDRQVNSKDHMIKASNIAHDRLILCEPEPQTDKEAIAGVEINI